MSAALAVGLVLGALVLGAVLWGAGALVDLWAPRETKLQIAAAVAIVAVLVDLRFKSRGWSVASVRRQTNKTWFAFDRQSQAWFRWGLDLGVGATTYRVGNLWLVASLLSIVFLSDGGAVLAPISYALVSAVSILIVSGTAIRVGASSAPPGTRLLRQASHVKHAANALSSVVVVVTLLAA